MMFEVLGDIFFYLTKKHKYRYGIKYGGTKTLKNV
jgi:hypothetical protein